LDRIDNNGPARRPIVFKSHMANSADTFQIPIKADKF
jgi:hypothetical protein